MNFILHVLRFLPVEQLQIWKKPKPIGKVCVLYWEKSEAFLLGPVSTENIDPGIDTWPVDYRSLDSLLATTNTFDQPFINSLGDELKGFHPCEYLFWGTNSNKLPADLTNKECEYLIALALDLRSKSEFLKNRMEPSTADNHLEHMINAGNPTSVYTSKKAAFEEVVNALSDNRPTFNANGNEWRTPPLWGIGLTQIVNGHNFFLHDGSARTMLEAILWYGGERSYSADYVKSMNREDREALLAFLKSL